MARIRTIKPEFFDDPKTGKASPFARLTFIGLLTQSDSKGRLEDEPERLKVRILPYDDVDMDVILSDLASLGVIWRYEADGKRVIQIVNFEKHQRPHPKEAPSLLPEPAVKKNGKPGKNTASRKKPGRAVKLNALSGVLDSGSLDSGVLEDAPAPMSEPDGFAAFWSVWPAGHRVGRKQAVEQWQPLSKEDRATALAEVAWRVEHDPSWQAPREDGRWAIPHPFRYLRDGRFTDARPTEPPRAPTARRDTAVPMPVYTESWCLHDPRCASPDVHALILAREQEASRA